ncbi:MAG TPA: hypothetical protein VIK81_02840 [Patescibacteria group bacterium]
MARTEIKLGNGVQLELNFKSGGTVVVFENDNRNLLHETAYYYPQESAVDPAIIQSLTQDVLNFGADDADSNGNLKKFQDLVTEAKNRSFEYIQIVDAVRDTIEEMKVDGKKMGSLSKKLIAAEKFILNEALDTYTQPIT